MINRKISVSIIFGAFVAGVFLFSAVGCDGLFADLDDVNDQSSNNGNGGDCDDVACSGQFSAGAGACVGDECRLVCGQEDSTCVSEFGDGAQCQGGFCEPPDGLNVGNHTQNQNQNHTQNQNQTPAGCDTIDDCTEELQICDEGACTASMSCEEECDSGLACYDGVVCMWEGADCTGSGDCPEEWSCDDGACHPDSDDNNGGGSDPSGLYTVRIDDRTYEEDSDRCEDTVYGYETPGAKLMYLRLENENGDTLAWGEAVAWIPVDVSQPFSYVEDVLDGTAPDLDDEGTCPAVREAQTSDGEPLESNFHHTGVYPMGCEGRVYVQFFDNDANPLAIEQGYTVTIGEYGLLCADQFEDSDPQTDNDYYSVYFCHGDDLGQITEYPEDECIDVLGGEPLSETSPLTLTLP